MKYVVITGASTGIGYDAARYLIERGYHVFGSVRKQADADRVQNELGEQFTPLLFDVTDGTAVETAVSQVSAKIGNNGLAGLINNAGIAVAGPLMHLPLEEFRWQMEVNLYGQLDVTQKFLPLLGAVPNAPHPPGRIVNISSVSGKVVYPFMGPYAASKHALEAISDALRRELLIFGIDVIVIGPGSVQTPIWDKAQDLDTEPYKQTPYRDMIEGMKKVFISQGKSGIAVEKVSEVIYKALTKENPKARYSIARDLLSGWLLPRYLPSRMFDNIIAKRLGITK
ncbi:SDR family oxidoreductase [Candidatus Leptofilum sp.]|uniref:SDR family oxidoreductase n=1 Tax=Candidatus Leptofilum sp. TaxID=3241576 RepID=UPI003B5C5A66